jgi:phosphoheptose isomerase
VTDGPPLTDPGAGPTPGLPADAVRRHLLSSAEVKLRTAEHCADDAVLAAALVAEAFRGEGRLLLCGNGGSAADCQHIAAEFVSCLNQRFVRRAFAAVALTTDTSFLTANANDFGFEHVFARQVEALGRVGDVVLGITTSGNSPNVVAALARGRQLGLRTVALTGAGGGLVAGVADVCIRVPSDSTQHIQEAHIALGHVICELVEQELCAA